MACGPPLGTTAASTSASKKSSGGNFTANNNTTPTAASAVQVSLTDDPYPYPVFSRMSLRMSKLEMQDGTGNWVTIQDWGTNPGVFEVLNLRNGKVTKVASKAIP